MVAANFTGKMTKALEWLGDRLRLLDQTRLPQEEVYLELRSYREVAAAIRGMKVRGAPAIGVAAAYGLALAAQQIEARSKEEFLPKLEAASQILASTRPTARNLFWALERLRKLAQESNDPSRLRERLVQEAELIQRENEQADRRIAEHGAALIPEKATILTHCNAGALATAGYGTALGVIKLAHQQGKSPRVYATETRPLLQGARLTTWELIQEGIPVTLITDSMAGYLLSQGRFDCVIVGADRIAANGDVANKIGTYPLAILARENSVPFYVAAPTSTIDLSLKSGVEIPIEERSPEEVTHIRGHRIPPEGVGVFNPAFDITPHRYITAIITEKGVVREPYGEGLSEVVGKGVNHSRPLLELTEEQNAKG